MYKLFTVYILLFFLCRPVRSTCKNPWQDKALISNNYVTLAFPPDQCIFATRRKSLNCQYTCNLAICYPFSFMSYKRKLEDEKILAQLEQPPMAVNGMYQLKTSY